MAKATPAPMIRSIHGRIGNMVFYFRNGRQCVRIHVIPRNPDTEAQRIIRRVFGDAVRSWQAMTDDERYVFNRKARYMTVSGYNLYISEYMRTGISRVSGEKIISGYSDHTAKPVSFSSLTSVSHSNKSKSIINRESPGLKFRPG